MEKGNDQWNRLSFKLKERNRASRLTKNIIERKERSKGGFSIQNTGVKLAEIIRKLSRLPGSKLDEVNDFVGFLLSRDKRDGRRNIHMKGIWAGKGFEELDVQKEIKALRKNISESI